MAIGFGLLLATSVERLEIKKKRKVFSLYLCVFVLNATIGEYEG